MKQIMELEDLDEKDAESEFFEAVGKLELKGSNWVLDRIAAMSIDLQKDVPKGRDSYKAFRGNI